MAGGHVKHRHLSRNSSARQALLRGLVTSLVAHEHIHTTYAKAKEAQRLADKLITYAKRDNEETRRKAQAVLYTPHDLLPKLFGELRSRYAERPGGYTRVLRTEPRNSYDQAPSAILEFVDGPRDTRFMMTAKAVAQDRILGRKHTDLTQKNLDKVTRYRQDGKNAFEKMAANFKNMTVSQQKRSKALEERKARKQEGA
ncbi:54S ribosomal protein L8, mitochondrial [Colletotrichum chlorophyti]|uniref:Large ribosomal subunit protein bL17m n=1 Tax=Colletotrichum chlorophyti TaxID=708187 RepID=A0A1Q8RCX3_9PEZI|nr:54S ribosomal protein L8, mitochondrial [Colletotrichum chlorophyti]